MKPNPPKMVTRQKKEPRKPFINLNVMIAPGKTGKIALHDDDSKNFIILY